MLIFRVFLILSPTKTEILELRKIRLCYETQNFWKPSPKASVCLTDIFWRVRNVLLFFLHDLWIFQPPLKCVVSWNLGDSLNPSEFTK